MNFKTNVYPLKRQEKMYLKMSSAKSSAVNFSLTLLTNLSIEANSADPEQTAPILNKSENATLQLSIFNEKVLDKKYLLKLNNVAQTSSKRFVETPPICLV